MKDELEIKNALITSAVDFTDSGNGMNIPKQSVHYKAPIDKGQITELQPNQRIDKRGYVVTDLTNGQSFEEFKKSDLPEVKAVTDKESFDLIYNNGYREAINKAGEFVTAYMRSVPVDVKTAYFYTAFNAWIEEQRESLTN